MKHLLVTITVLLTSVNLMAGESIGIIDIDPAINTNENHMIYGSDGVIYEVANSNKKLLGQLQFAKQEQVEIEIDLSASSEITSLLGSRDLIIGASFTNTELDQVIVKKLSKFRHGKILQSPPTLQNLSLIHI